ncbi:hypothetical protein LB553_07240 [Mesorhizobium sp. CA8]|uniref:hypothetical protein n=1 Tax=Mesorhizobium sp. CA8 TaxID=2876637 RepID=UPI001CCCFE85|nr:hypothetical protein [Mesorhizobium sp. CA8]MBZ9760672.1 hypothetical protein [Mesorhizobium sp. CA8]
MGRALLLWWYCVIVFASVANPAVAIYLLGKGENVGAAYFAALSIPSWMIARNTFRDRR